jgi:hypothetical protein
LLTNSREKLIKIGAGPSEKKLMMGGIGMPDEDEKYRHNLSQVLREEFEALRPECCADSWEVGDEKQKRQEAYKIAHNLQFSALALSGGSIRSACVALGVIQALAEAKLLHHFDYLSTVSGGGYIGSWLSAWLYWNKKAGGNAQTVLSAQGRRHLGRNSYGNFRRGR